MEGDRNYFLRRAEQERSAASGSNDPKARQAHLELAERYDDLARGSAAAPNSGA